jgi:hypothetical protein
LNFTKRKSFLLFSLLFLYKKDKIKDKSLLEEKNEIKLPVSNNTSLIMTLTQQVSIPVGAAQAVWLCSGDCRVSTRASLW